MNERKVIETGGRSSKKNGTYEIKDESENAKEHRIKISRQK
jgi:hypothetical protein